MKTVLALVFLIAGITALPQAEEHATDLVNDRKLINGTVASVIKAVSQAIRDAGLDPYHIEKKEFRIFNSAAFVEELLFSGLSNIVVHKVTYAVVGSRLNFDIELPLIHFSVGAASNEINLFGHKFVSKASGNGEIRVHLGLGGVSVRGIKITFTLGGIDAAVNVSIQDKNYSNEINTFLNKTIPDTLKEYNGEVNELIENTIWVLINPRPDKV